MFTKVWKLALAMVITLCFLGCGMPMVPPGDSGAGDVGSEHRSPDNGHRQYYHKNYPNYHHNHYGNHHKDNVHRGYTKGRPKGHQGNKSAVRVSRPGGRPHGGAVRKSSCAPAPAKRGGGGIRSKSSKPTKKTD